MQPLRCPEADVQQVQHKTCTNGKNLEYFSMTFILFRHPKTSVPTPNTLEAEEASTQCSQCAARKLMSSKYSTKPAHKT